MKYALTLLLAMCSALPLAPAAAHHSYAMFDQTKRATVAGTVAKVEWESPHAFVWLYVSDTRQPNGHVLYAMETGAPNMLIRQGWAKTTVKTGDKITVEYFPLKDGRPGGSLVKAVQADGKVLVGDPLSVKLLEALAEEKKKGAQP